MFVSFTCDNTTVTSTIVLNTCGIWVFLNIELIFIIILVNHILHFATYLPTQLSDPDTDQSASGDEHRALITETEANGALPEAFPPRQVTKADDDSSDTVSSTNSMELTDSESEVTASKVLIFYSYRKTSSIIRTKFQICNVSCIPLQLSSLNPLKPGVKLRMKM